MKRLSILLFVLLLAVPAMAEIRIGGLFAVTGPAGYLGLPEKQTAEMLVDQINAAGGINGEKVTLITYDTQGDEKRAINFYKRLVTNDNVVAVLGPTRTGCAIALKNFAERFKVPVISCAASAQIVEAPANTYMFKTPQSDTHVAEKIYEYMQMKGMKNVALISAQSGYGATGREALLALAKQMNVNIVADEKFQDTDKDMTSQLNKIKAKNPDAVICWGVGPAPAIVARNAKDLGIGNLFMSQGIASKTFVELAGDAANGIIFPAGRIIVAEQLKDGDRFKNVLMTYKADFESKFGAQVNSFGGHAYDAFQLFKLGYEKSGGKGGIDLVKGIEQVQGYLGTAGEFRLAADDHNGLNKDAFVMVQIEGGAFKLIE